MLTLHGRTTRLLPIGKIVCLETGTVFTRLKTGGSNQEPYCGMTFRTLFCTGCIVVLVLAGLVSRAQAQVGNGPHLTFNITTGDVYSARNAFDQWYPASLTKVMTAYTVFREIERGFISMKSPVRISENALHMPPSKVGFPVGTILTVEAALKIILVKSANDVSLALAESVGGSEVQFVNLMNRYAQEIGMERSHFANPHGLHDPHQYSTAHDLGLLTRQIYLKYPEYVDLFAIGSVKVGGKNMRNHNALLRQLPGTIGFKTGFICAGGVSLIATREKDDEIIASILMGERKAQIRNLKVAEFLDAASQPSAGVIGRIEIMNAPPHVRPPADISDYVCGRKRLPVAEFLYEDPAIEIFAVRRPETDVNIPERESRLYSSNDLELPNISISQGGATGPDPYLLLVEKPPIELADSDGETSKRFNIAEGVVIATPTPRPES